MNWTGSYLELVSVENEVEQFEIQIIFSYFMANSK